MTCVRRCLFFVELKAVTLFLRSPINISKLYSNDYCFLVFYVEQVSIHIRSINIRMIERRAWKVKWLNN